MCYNDDMGVRTQRSGTLCALKIENNIVRKNELSRSEKRPFVQRATVRFYSDTSALQQFYNRRIPPDTEVSDSKTSYFIGTTADFNLSNRRTAADHCVSLFGQLANFMIRNVASILRCVFIARARKTFENNYNNKMIVYSRDSFLPYTRICNAAHFTSLWISSVSLSRFRSGIYCGFAQSASSSS